MQSKAKKMIAIAAAISMLTSQFFVSEGLLLKQTYTQQALI